jgi:hypothetical protein
LRQRDDRQRRNDEGGAEEGDDPVHDLLLHFGRVWLCLVQSDAEAASFGCAHPHKRVGRCAPNGAWASLAV